MVSIDIPALEAGAIACSIVFPATRVVRWWLGRDEKPDTLMLFLDLLRGAAFFPFVILTAGAFSNDILQHLINGNRHHVFLAGIIGAVSVFKSDRWMIEFSRRTHRAPAALPATATVTADAAANTLQNPPTDPGAEPA